MADVKLQIEVKPRDKQNIPPVLQTLYRKQNEASEDSHDPDAANEAVGSRVPNNTTSAKLDIGNQFNETTNRNVVQARPGLATKPNPPKAGQGKVPAAAAAFHNNIAQGQDSTSKKPTSSTTRSYIKMTNQSSDQHQVTKQSININLVEKVPQKLAQVNETKSKTFNNFSPKSTNTTVSSSSSSSSTLPVNSPSSNDDGVVIDFRSALRPTRNSVLSELFDNSTSTSTTSSTMVSTGSSKIVEPSSSSSSSPSSSSPSAVGLQTNRASWKSRGAIWPPQTATAGGQSSINQLQGGNSKNVAQKAGQSDVRTQKSGQSDVRTQKSGQSDVVSRSSDHRQFRRIGSHVLATDLPAPPTPRLPNNVDLTEVTQRYHSLLGNIQHSPKTRASDVVPAKSEDKKRPGRDSLIKEISADEEDATLYDDGYSLSPHLATGDEELYADGESETQADGGKDEDIYEEAVLLADARAAKATKQQLKDKAEVRKREEKERKEKEKEEKKRLKDEKLTGNEVMVGDGVMKQDFKDMSLKEGQTVTIVRLDRNPPNMWLIKTQNSLGYVSSSLIEVEPLVIRQAMNNIKKSIDDDEDDSIYVDVDAKWT